MSAAWHADGILRLEETVGAKRLEATCARALHYGHAQLRTIRAILHKAEDLQPLAEEPAPAQEQAYEFARPAVAYFPAEVGPC